MIEIVLPLVILITGLIAANKWTKSKSEKKKRIIWGIMLMVILGPAFAWLVGGLYAVFGTVETTGWMGIIAPVLLFALLFLIGLYNLLMGIFK